MDILLRSYFNFTTFVEKLKKLERFKGQFYWKDYPKLARYESVADHTWRLGVLVLLFHDQLSQSLDLKKALKIVLVHDLQEIIAGDDSPMGRDGTGRNTYAFNEKKAVKRNEKEIRAAKSLFKKLPRKKAKELFDLWLDYEEQRSFEAKVVKALDKIECMLQVLEYRKGLMFPKHFEFTIEYGVKGSDVDPAIFRFGKLIAKELRRKYRPFR